MLYKNEFSSSKDGIILFIGIIGRPMFVDTHSHLFWESFKEDFEKVIQNAVDAKVNIIINVGVDVALSKKAAELESLNPEITFYSSIAIHPEEAKKYLQEKNLDEDIRALEEIYLKNPKKVIAVGECGLDYMWDKEEKVRKMQKKLLLAQIDLAKKLNLPLLVHVRDDRSENLESIECWNEAIDITKDHFGIYHCYSGMGKITERILSETNFLISFAGNLTYPQNEYLKAACKIVPIERTVLETDSPFLPPQSIRGKRNEPSSVKEIAQLVAELKGISLKEVGEKTTENVKKLFKLK